MNYRHAFHAGNFADVLKHAVLALVIEHMKLKAKPFRVIDTHAGIARYRLDGPEALRTGEWRGGIGQLLGPQAATLPETIEALLAPYLGVVRGLNPDGDLSVYPGSPLLALGLMRESDRLVASELHPEDARQLAAEIGRDPRVRVLELDGWMALKANLPPKERRGVALVDPPFELAGELDRLLAALREGLKRFATGTYILWLPIKDRQATARFELQLGSLGLEKVLRVEFAVGGDPESQGLGAAGLVIVNPPFRLEEQLEVLLPFLAERLGRDAQAGWRMGASGGIGRGSITTA
jgi:23S rRNA (adenine2030-N6)-methyltransferase